MSLWDNQISDVSFLLELKSVQFLVLWGNPLDCCSVIGIKEYAGGMTILHDPLPDDCECAILPDFRRGDTNDDGKQNLTDAVFVLDHLFGGGDASPCTKSADANDSGTVDLTDPVFLLSSLFADGPPPPAPFTECGPDPTDDDLTCESFAACR